MSKINQVHPQDDTYSTSGSSNQKKILTQKNPPKLQGIVESDEKCLQLIQPQKRYDSKGIQIIKGQRKHHIKFKDPIEQVKIVENWKKLNGHEGDFDDERCPCQLI